MSSTDLVQFLRARLAEDEQTARAAHAPNWSTDGRTGLHYGVEDGWMTDALTTADADHIARHDPARVLRDINAKRDIVAQYEEAASGAASDDWLIRDTWRPALRILDPVLRALAQPYVDHPDYHDGWRP